MPTFSASRCYDEGDQRVFFRRCEQWCLSGRGVVDLKVGIILGVSMFLGALLGARIALFLSNGVAASNIRCGSARASGYVCSGCAMKGVGLYSHPTWLFSEGIAEST